MTPITFRLHHQDYIESLQAHVDVARRPPPTGPGTMLPPNGVVVTGGPLPTPGGKRKQFPVSLSMVGWTLILTFSAVIFVVFHEKAPVRPVPAPTPRPRDSLIVQILTSGPALVVIAVMLVFLFLRSYAVRRKWRKFDRDPAFQQERTLEVFDWGLRISVPTVRHEYEWLAYKRVVETANLFLLYEGDLAYHIVPKRAFAGEADIAVFRTLVGQQIGDRRTGAFPVLPAQER